MAGEITDGVDDAHGQDLLLDVDPFSALLDGRRQLAEVLQSGIDEARSRAALAAVIAHDEALREVATGYAAGVRDFASVPLPATRNIEPCDPPTAAASRHALIESLAGIADRLDEIVTTPWGGDDTWRMHLITHAIHDGLHADALRRGEPPPGPIATRSDPR